MNLNPMLCVTENDEVSSNKDEIINSIVKKMDVVDSNSDSNNVEYVKKDNFKKIIGDIRVDILGILNVLGMLNKNVIKENTDNKELYKEISDLKQQINVLNQAINYVPQIVNNQETVITTKEKPIMALAQEKAQEKAKAQAQAQAPVSIRIPNIRVANPLEKPKTPNINKKNPHFVNNTTQKITNVKTLAPNNLMIQKTAPNNDRTTDSRRR
jgi:TolA-binding protein